MLLLVGPVAFPGCSPATSEPTLEANSKPSLDGAAASVSHLHRGRFPKRVIDPDGALEFFRRTIFAMSDNFASEFGIHLEVVIYPFEEGDVAQVANEIFALREIGHNAPTGGILVLVNPARSQARIEVSYSLEGALTDAVISRIVRDQLDPYASYDAMGMAIQDVIAILESQIYLQSARGNLELATRFRKRDEYQRKREFYSGGAGAQIRLSSIPTDRDFKARLEDPARSRFAPSADALEAADIVMDAHAAFIGDPTLELLAPGTQVLRSFYPFAPFEKLERWYARDASRPFRVMQRGDRAVVTSDDPATGFIPFLFHRIDGVWRYDEVELWKNVFSGASGLIQRTKNPYSFGLLSHGEGQARDLGAWDVGERTLGEVVDYFESRDDALGHYLYADLLFRNAWLIVIAYREYLAATEAAPHASLFWETLGERASYLGDTDMAIAAFKRVGIEARQKLVYQYERLGVFDDSQRIAEEILADDPYRLPALRSLRYAHYKKNEWREHRVVDARIDALDTDERRPHLPVTLTVTPERPALETNAPKQLASGESVYDYSDFAVTFKNTSARAIRMTSIECEQRGTDGIASLGDITDRWRFASSNKELASGETVTLNATWGFARDTEHSYVAHVFRYCWLGVGEREKQCRTARVDQLPL